MIADQVEDLAERLRDPKNYERPLYAGVIGEEAATLLTSQQSEIARLTQEVEAAREALEPFAAVAAPINGEAGRISILESIEGKNGTGELYLATHFGTDRYHTMWADDFRKARATLTGHPTKEPGNGD